MNFPPESLARFDHIVVLGDSLSDNGNVGRASNGPVGVEQLAERAGLALQPSRIGGSNFAVGGALLDPRSGDTSLRAQATAYLRAPRPRGRILHIVYGGANDMLRAVGAPQTSIVIDAAIASLRSIVADLADRGASNILVPNLPGLGITPAMRARGQDAVEAADKLAEHFNNALDQVLSGFARSDGPRLHCLDVWKLAEEVRADPTAVGFMEIALPCGEGGNCEGYLFWDDVHPTTKAHQHLADAAIQVLSTSSETSKVE
jgi:phospholipase/lecithinase/hemolysin